MSYKFGRLLAASFSVISLAAPSAAAMPIDGPAPEKPKRPAPPVSPVMQAIAECESGGDPTAVSPDGRYRGKYQFSRETWRSLGGTGDPAAAPEAEQDRLAAELMRRQGPSAWPTCSKR